MSVAIKVILAAAKVLADKENRQKLLIIVLIPVGIVIILISIFVYKSTDEDVDVYLIAAKEVSAELKTINKLDGNLVKGIYFLYPDKVTEDLSEVSQFIKDFFVRTITETIIVNGKKVVVKYYAFKSYLEIQAMILLPPFSFDVTEMALVNLYLLMPPEEGFDDDYPTWGDGDSSGGGITGGSPGDIPNIGDDGNPSILPFRLKSPCSGAVTSYFGMRTHPVTGEELSFHTGIDIQGAHHQPIVSAADGIVIDTNTAVNGYGNYVKIKHTVQGITFYTFYAHLSSIGVSTGQSVLEGQTIGLEGGANGDNNPGVSTGHHLHFEIRLKSGRSSCIDPAPYIS